MKKFFVYFILSAFLISLCSGCSGNRTSVGNNQLTEPVEEVTEAVITEPAEEKIIMPVKEVYIYDNAKILSDEDLTECNNYAGWINKNLMLNTAVVITDKLDNISPAEYAEKCFNNIFKNDVESIEDGINNGILLLINNDTNKDYIYKHGNVSSYITEKSEKESLFYATKSIVKGDFKPALNQLLSLAELCPKYIFDNASLFTYEQIAELENVLESNSNLNISVFTYDNPENNNILDIYKRHCSDNAGTMILINKSSSEFSVVSDNKVVKSEKQTDGFKDYYNTVKKHLENLGVSFASDVS
ncbi:MAG: TPM domain-containing protein [Oscillospiraceae bacterium]|nr:TPM domain-containing protein [Oscillospiraceae bacterium]